MAAPSKALLQAFDRFWAAYPSRRPNPKAAALALFIKLVRAGVDGLDADALVEAAGRYAQECAALATPNDFICHAKTFLGPQQRFKDYLASAEPDAPPSPDGPAQHPLDFLRVSMTGGEFAVWIAPLLVEQVGQTHRISARTQLALDRVRKDWGGEIAERLGPITWSVERKTP